MQNNTLIQLYRDLVLVRECEEQIRKVYFENDMKTPVHLGIGSEAVSVGVKHSLPPGTSCFATYRNHAIFLALSQDTDGFFGEMYGKVTGCGKGKAGSMHMSAPEYGLVATSAVVGTTIPLAVGAALANKYNDSEALSCVFFGDGAVEEGVFWESLNFAALHKLRVLFVCEDNEFAIHTHQKHRQGFKSLLEVARNFGCHLGSCDGTDVEKVYSTSTDVVGLMKQLSGPGFLHLPYHRFLEHVGPNEDYSAGYRSKPEAREDRFDPIFITKRRLLETGVPNEMLEIIQKETLEKIAVSVTKAKAAPFPDSEELFVDTYSPSIGARSPKTNANLFPGMQNLYKTSSKKILGVAK